MVHVKLIDSHVFLSLVKYAKIINRLQKCLSCTPITLTPHLYFMKSWILHELRLRATSQIARLVGPTSICTILEKKSNTFILLA